MAVPAFDHKPRDPGFVALWNATEAGRSPALAALRAAAIARYAAVGVPTPRSEDFKYTSLAPLAKASFTAPIRNDADPGFELPAGPRLVFVDGYARPDLSELTGNLDWAFDPQRGPLLDADPFVELNTAFLDGGASLRVRAGERLADPIHLVFVSTRPGQAVHPRTVVVLGDGAEAAIVEHFIGVPGAYLTNAVTEIVLGTNAGLRHTKVESEGEGAFHLATVQVAQGRDSRYALESFAFGGRIARTRVGVTLDQGASVDLVGLYLASGDQLHDHHTLVDHCKPHGTSREMFKGILDKGGHGVFTGRIVVREDAQKTDSAQSVKNLLLSDDAVANARPQLEILADDVKCAHGAAVGRLDQEALFYLRSRGLDQTDARKLLTYAFASEAVGRVKDDAIRALVETRVHDWLVRLEAA